MWTDCLDEPRSVTVLYGGAPDVRGFALYELVLRGEVVMLKGDFRQLPSPFPKRWAERGYTHAGAVFSASDVDECQVLGTPGVHFDNLKCLEGDPVDLVSVASRKGTPMAR